MADPYGKVNAGHLTFKDGDLAIRSKSIDKKHKKKKKKPETILSGDDVIAVASETLEQEEGPSAAVGEDIYAIDAAKKMKYDELFPVEAKKFGYDPKAKELKSVEEALDDRRIIKYFLKLVHIMATVSCEFRIDDMIQLQYFQNGNESK